MKYHSNKEDLAEKYLRIYDDLCDYVEIICEDTKMGTEDKAIEISPLLQHKRYLDRVFKNLDPEKYREARLYLKYNTKMYKNTPERVKKIIAEVANEL